MRVRLSHALLWALTLAPAVEAGSLAERLGNPTDFAAIVRGGSETLASLREALKGPRPDLAIRAIGRLKLAAAVPDLLPFAKHDDGELRTTAAWALGECGGDSARAALLALTQDSYARARAAAVAALARSPGKEVEAALRRAVRDHDPSVRLAAVRSIRDGGRRALFGALLPLLGYEIEVLPDPADKRERPKLVATVVWQEPAKHVRLAGIQALDALKVPDGLPALIQALEREESFNRLHITAAIEGMGERAINVCLGRIVPMAYDKENFAKHMPLLVNNGVLAVIAGRLGDERCVPVLLDTLKLPRRDLGANKDLTELYIETVRLLGRYRVTRAARHLVALLKETQIRQLSEATQESIRQIGRAAARPLARSLDDWRMAPVFFPLLREKELYTSAARDTILKYLSHESDEVRFEATETLGLYLCEGVLDEYDVPALKAMELDPNDDVRARTAYWLQRMQTQEE